MNEWRPEANRAEEIHTAGKFGGKARGMPVSRENSGIPGAQSLRKTGGQGSEKGEQIPAVARMMAALMTPRAYRKWIYPALAELQAEYFEAHYNQEARWRLRWIHARGIVSLIPGWLWGLFAGLVAKGIKW